MPAKRRTKTRTAAHLEPEVWYDGGLDFTCQECGNCCTGAPGYVFVAKEEIDRIAALIGREGKGLTKKHIRRVGRRCSLTEDKRTGDCCFLHHTGGKRSCRIYPVRPLQCRVWPFWTTNLTSPHAWASASFQCPGMNHGRRYNLVQIEIRRKAKSWKDLSS